MDIVAKSLITLAAATWVGAIVFQSAVVAPSVFKLLGDNEARVLLRGLFPRFYRLGLVCGGLMLAGLALLSIRYGTAGWLSTLVAVTLVMVLLEAASLTLVPRINAARDAGANGARVFERLHRLSVSLTIAVLLLGATLLVRLSHVPALAGGA